jgi:uncharacterized lipoprotein YddW (UPF0748 family)
MTAINIHIQVKIDMAELEDWSSEQIDALFEGIAKVVRAQDPTPPLP